MSIASGRAWQAAGAGLGNIGRLLVEQQEREREQRRLEEAEARYAGQMAYSRGRDVAGDERLALDRQRQEAQFGEQAGINYVPATSNVRKVLSGTTTVEPIALPNIGQVALGAGKETRTPGYYKTQPSALERRALVEAEGAAQTAATVAQDAAYYLGRHPELAGLSPAEQVRRGRELENRRPVGDGGGVPSGPAGALRLRPIVQEQLTNAEQRAAEAREGMKPFTFGWRRGAVGELPEVERAAAAAAIPLDSARAAWSLGEAERRVGEFTARQDSLARVAFGGPPAAAPAPAMGPPTPVRAAPSATAPTTKIPVTQQQYDAAVRRRGAALAAQYYVVSR